MDEQELLLALRTIVKEELAPVNTRLDGMDRRLDGLEQRMSHVEDTLEEIKEDAAITREATNTLLNWAEQAQVEVRIPLYRKAE